MLVTVKDMTGKQVGEVQLDESIFAVPVNKSLMHQALVRQLANARLGTHKTKGRSEVRGGGRKPWRQKGTGRARQGSTRAPNWVGGGTVFGPQPRKYTKSMPRKMRRSALRSALTVKADADQIIVVDRLAMDAPKTKAMLSSLDSLGVADSTVLLVLADKNENIQRSANNLPNVKTLNAAYLNIHDLLGYDTLLFSSDALAYVEAWLGNVNNNDGDDSAVEYDTPAVVDVVDEEAPIAESSGESEENVVDEGPLAGDAFDDTAADDDERVDTSDEV